MFARRLRSATLKRVLHPGLRALGSPLFSAGSRSGHVLHNASCLVSGRILSKLPRFQADSQTVWLFSRSTPGAEVSTCGPTRSHSFFRVYQGRATLGPVGGTGDNSRTPPPGASRSRPTATLAFLLATQLQFLAVLSLVRHSVADENSLLADFVVGLR